MKKITNPIFLLSILFLIGIIVGFLFHHYQPLSETPILTGNNQVIQQTPPPTKAPTLPPSTPTIPTKINQKTWFEVPFTSQAPLGEWDDSLQQDGCEEASSLMAVSWVKGETFQSPQQTLNKLKEISFWQQENYNSAIDTSAQDTLNRIIKGYFNHQSAQLLYPKQPTDIIKALTEDQLIIAPMNGQLLNNPYFTSPGPERHMLVIIGYDPQTKEFITNDPGTRRGQNYRYNEQVLWQAIRDYTTGDHQPITTNQKVIILVQKSL